MTDRTVVDGSLFFRARRRSAIQRRSPRPPVYSVLLLAPDVSIGELLCALRFSGLDLTTDRATGNQILHRRPGPKPAA